MSDPYQPLLEALAAKQIETRASLLTLRFLAAESLAEREGIPLADAVDKIEHLEQRMHSHLLLETEKNNPAAAARLDLRSLEDVAGAEEN